MFETKIDTDAKTLTRWQRPKHWSLACTQYRLGMGYLKYKNIPAQTPSEEEISIQKIFSVKL
jgi:hypothetical protein